MRLCAKCKAPFEPSPHSRIKYCTEECRKAEKRQRAAIRDRKLYTGCAHYSRLEKWTGDTSKRKKSRAMAAKLKMEIHSMRLYGSKTYLTDAERGQIRENLKQKMGSPHVWWGVKERRRAQ